jgi:hypothetical protein
MSIGSDTVISLISANVATMLSHCHIAYLENLSYTVFSMARNLPPVKPGCVILLAVYCLSWIAGFYILYLWFSAPN